jgi:hypothetical protein
VRRDALDDARMRLREAIAGEVVRRVHIPCP